MRTDSDQTVLNRRYVVAVSGGVDSMVLLDMLMSPTSDVARSLKVKDGVKDIVVAHFDHGIRSESAEDAEFVKMRAEHYGVGCETMREELGAQASESYARDRRYRFLREVANKYAARIVTAHHMNDIVETVAINCTRGTGWRGLAVLSSGDVERPLLGTTKVELVEYARVRDISWREDVTNQDTKYLRNDLRRRLKGLTLGDMCEIAALRSRQLELRKQIEAEFLRISPESLHSRYFYMHLDLPVALECVRYVTRGQLTRPQADRLLLAIKTMKAGAVMQAGSGVRVKFTLGTFDVQFCNSER